MKHQNPYGSFRVKLFDGRVYDADGIMNESEATHVAQAIHELFKIEEIKIQFCPGFIELPMDSDWQDW